LQHIKREFPTIQSPKITLHWFKQAVRALDYMQNKAGAYHLDIKPENLFLDHNHNCIIGDFGFCKTSFEL
jgi:serine/threonine protein kinase